MRIQDEDEEMMRSFAARYNEEGISKLSLPRPNNKMI